MSQNGGLNHSKPIDYLIHLAPLWYLPPLLQQLSPPYPKQIIAIGSTSVLTKQASTSHYEQQVVQKLLQAEQALADFATQKSIHWTLLRPTLIYAQQRDKNISQIARFIKRFGFFPLVGNGQGLRQPIHAEDIALACLAVLNNEASYNKAYNISGGETLNYQAMVTKIFSTLNRKPRFVTIPDKVLQLMLTSLRIIPRYHDLTPNMAQRMNQDLVFDHSTAQLDFGFSPRPFQPLT
ncbi:NAD-dependent epimerase/dehydratase family protein [Thiofilum flexile]|uniref:NAD-dependent epimerase/dehydratase family protein n=1 Tax=Thiofilum flexile TaxID=125627 RepID=UPI000375704C|nr:NAD-dependent epimerase/dehydratase family protein [Thiofilum flexile]